MCGRRSVGCFFFGLIAFHTLFTHAVSFIAFRTCLDRIATGPSQSPTASPSVSPSVSVLASLGHSSERYHKSGTGSQTGKVFLTSLYLCYQCYQMCVADHCIITKPRSPRNRSERVFFPHNGSRKKQKIPFHFCRCCFAWHSVNPLFSEAAVSRRCPLCLLASV